MRLGDRHKPPLGRRGRFCGPQQQHAARLERVVHQFKNRTLILVLEINQEVATADKIKFGKRRITDQVMNREYGDLPDSAADLVAVARLHQKTIPVTGRQAGHGVTGVIPHAGGFDRVFRQVGGKNSETRRVVHALRQVQQNHRQGVGFLARRTGRHPRPERLASRVRGQLLPQLFPNGQPDLLVTKKRRDRDQNAIGQCSGLVRVLL